MMQTRRRVRAFDLICIVFLTLCGRSTAQSPARCAHILFCLFNQEALATDPAGIHKYSQDLIELIAPPEAGKAYIGSLTDRLASGERAARAGRGGLVPETELVRAFNELMSEIGAPSSLRTDEAAVHGFREHAASIGAFPALFTAERNGTDCSPGEAVFLVYLLISNDGVLYVGNLDAAKELMQPGSGLSGGRSFGVYGVMQAPVTSSLLASYAFEHKRSETVALFNHMADSLGF